MCPIFLGGGSDPVDVVLAFEGQPSLHGYDACMVYWTKGHIGEFAGKNLVRPLFFSFKGFSV